MSLSVVRPVQAQAWQDGDMSWVHLRPEGGPSMRITHQVLGSIPGGPWPSDTVYPAALRRGGTIFGLGAAESSTPEDAWAAYNQALIAVDILQDVDPSNGQLNRLRARLDQYAQQISQAERGDGSVSASAGQQIEVDARTALRDALRRKQLFSSVAGAALVGGGAALVWYILSKRR